MKGFNHVGFVSKAGNRGLATPTRVQSAPSIRGQQGRAGSTKTSSAGGFLASRKKGSVKGCS